MRFKPDADDVVLVIHDPAAASNPNSVILYCNDLGVCVDEGKTDRSLQTHHDPNRGIVQGVRFKHFSGLQTGGVHGRRLRPVGSELQRQLVELDQRPSPHSS